MNANISVSSLHVDYYWHSIHDHEQLKFYLAISAIVCLYCSVLIVWMCHRKNFQPLKRMSPNLTIASLIGQYLVVLNIIGCIQYF